MWIIALAFLSLSSEFSPRIEGCKVTITFLLIMTIFGKLMLKQKLIIENSFYFTYPIIFPHFSNHKYSDSKKIYSGRWFMYIYIDVLIVTSVYVDYLLLRVTAAVLKRYARVSGCIVGALIGSLFSLTILLPPMNILLSSALKIIPVTAAVYAAFGFGSVRRYASAGVVFFGAGVLFAGVCGLLAQTSAGSIIMYRNGSVYFSISLPLLIISTGAAYAAVRLYNRFSGNDITSSGTYTITLYRNRKSVSLTAVADTGNRLTDSITGSYVIVCGREQLKGLFSEDEDIPDSTDMSLSKGWRLIPCTTAFGSGLIPVFRPDMVCIRCDETRKVICTEALVGAAPEKMEAAVFNPENYF